MMAAGNSLGAPCQLAIAEHIPAVRNLELEVHPIRLGVAYVAKATETTTDRDHRGSQEYCAPRCRCDLHDERTRYLRGILSRHDPERDPESPQRRVASVARPTRVQALGLTPILFRPLVDRPPMRMDPDHDGRAKERQSLTTSLPRR